MAEAAFLRDGRLITFVLGLLFSVQAAEVNLGPNVFWSKASMFQSDRARELKDDFCRLVLSQAEVVLPLREESAEIAEEPQIWPIWSGEQPQYISAWNRSLKLFMDSDVLIPARALTRYSWRIMNSAIWSRQPLLGDVGFVPKVLGTVLQQRFDSHILDDSGKKIEGSNRHVVLANQLWDQALVNGVDWEDPHHTPSQQVRVHFKDGRTVLTAPVEMNVGPLSDPENILLILKEVTREFFGSEARFEDYVVGAEFACTSWIYEFAFHQRFDGKTHESMAMILIGAPYLQEAARVSGQLPPHIFFSTRLIFLTGYNLAVVFKNGKAL